MVESPARTRQDKFRVAEEVGQKQGQVMNQILQKKTGDCAGEELAPLQWLVRFVIRRINMKLRRLRLGGGVPSSGRIE